MPYNETRGYVQRILWHSLLFTWLRTDGEAQQTDSWLAPIRPSHRSDFGNRVAAE
jgi:soluble lytic murein transglycosylase